MIRCPTCVWSSESACTSALKVVGFFIILSFLEVVLIIFISLPLAYFTESLERRLKLEVILRQLENDPDRDVRESTNVPVVMEDSQMDETLESNRTNYLDETIECEPSTSSSVPEVVVVPDEEDEQPNQMTTTAEETGSDAVAETKEEEGGEKEEEVGNDVEEESRQ